MAQFDTLYIENFGPIDNAKISFGDLTVFVGPQASGKTIFAELFKLIKDKDFILHSIEETLKRQIDSIFVDETMDTFFGNGMNSLLKNNTFIKFNDDIFDLTTSLNYYDEGNSNNFSVYYIPAKRSAEFNGGQLKMAQDVSNFPYIMREFRDNLDAYLFPFQSSNVEYFELFDIDNSIFGKGKVGMQKKDNRGWELVQKYEKSIIDYMAWSTGQGEFTPLQLGLLDIAKNPGFEYVIIEEPEIGLHPQAIVNFVKGIVQLTNSTKVIVITHSPILLNFIWAIKNVDRNKIVIGNIAKEMFESNEESPFSNIFDKTISTYAFVKNERAGINVKDISNLDAWSNEDTEANWGGLTDFATITSNFVSKYYKEVDGE